MTSERRFSLRRPTFVGRLRLARPFLLTDSRRAHFVAHLRESVKSQRGNAILISLIIMASTLSISLGIAALVGSEIKTTGLLVPSERAYYKSESFIEQALWNKTKGDPVQAYGPTYQAPSRDVSDGGGRPAVKDQAYLCGTAPCFSVDPRSTDGLLRRFSATTQPTSDTFSLLQDEPQQLNIGGSAGAAVTLEATSIQRVAAGDQNPIANYQGLEVTIIANPYAATAPGLYQGVSGGAPSQTFIDKKRIAATATTASIPLTGVQNALGEAYPSFNSYYYRLRVKALGSDASATLKVVSGGNTLTLQTPDFTALAVTEDGKAQRGVQVVVPDVPEVLSIFDYVLFADADLEKLDAKRPAGAQDPSTITAIVYNDKNCNGQRSSGENGVNGVDTGLDGPQGAQSLYTDAAGTAVFQNLISGDYTVRFTTLPSGVIACPGQPSSQPVSLGAGQNPTVTYRVQSSGRVPIHQFWSEDFGDHLYLLDRDDADECQGRRPRDCYVYQGEVGYLYPQAGSLAGTVPLYWSYSQNQTDHFYTADLNEHNAAISRRRVENKGIFGYVWPPVSCGASSVPWYRYYDGRAEDHYYTRDFRPTGFDNYRFEGQTACIWNTE